MGLILYYIQATFFELLWAIPIVILIRIVRVFILRKKDRKTTIHHELGTGFFIYFMIALFASTINMQGLLAGSFTLSGNVSLIPFKGIGIILQSGDFGYITINILGNILMFSPIGFFLPLLWKKTKSIFTAVGAGFLISLFIECTQLFASRGTDVDDLILNTIGALVGYIVFCVFYKLFSKFTDTFIVKQQDD